MKFYIILILLTLLFVFNSLYDLQMLQQSGYNENGKYFKFYINELSKRFINYFLKCILVISLAFYNKLSDVLIVVLFIFTVGLVITSYKNYKKHNVKLPLKFTKRMVRITLVDYILFILIALLFKSYCFVTMALYIVLNPIMLLITLFLLKPVEKCVFNHFKKQAYSKLNRMENLKIIGITGSFGKTSTKMILDSILRTSYKGFFTPASFNTPNGILMTINQEQTIFNDYFICEMGAKRVGEIGELCDLAHPNIGILTSIGAAHLESFKNIDNVCKTKFELIESLPEDGIAILNKDDEYQRKYKIKNTCKVIWVGIEHSADVMAKNIRISNEGTTFDVYFKNSNETITVSTILLGIKNVYNILQSIALAKYLDVSNNAIIKGVKNIAPINHRLEIKKNNNLTIIDDSFNSNPEGAKNAVEVLSLMNGEKYIITPGMVEMGSKQAELNKKFGEQIADVCDKVYLVGPKQTEPIYEGLINKKYNKENIFVCKSFKEAYNNMLKKSGNKKVTVLIENDLPDSYSEE